MSIVEQIIKPEQVNSEALRQRYLEIIAGDVAGIAHDAKVVSELRKIIDTLGLTDAQVRSDVSFLRSLHLKIGAASGWKEATVAQDSARIAHEQAVKDYQRVTAEAGERIRTAKIRHEEACVQVQNIEHAQRQLAQLKPERPDLATEATIAILSSL